nr:LCP family protein [Pseudenhygromyxa sp. WMMC2535]
MGADNRRPGVTGRTDTMIVAAFRHRDGAVAAFSIPRDLWVELPDVPGLREQGRTHARISAVLRVGEVRVAKGQGMALLRRTLDEQFGVRVDRYASVDLQGFVALVDELGGVEVEVECPLMDCFWLDGADQACTLVDIPAGAQTMDGPTALAYARSRHGTGDRERIRRQQAVLLGFARAARVRGLRGLPALWRRVEPHLRTDMSPDDALYYASFALEGGLEGIRGFSVSSAMTQRHVTEDGKHVMLLDRAAFDEALAGIFDAPLPALRERKRCPARDAALTYADRG